MRRHLRHWDDATYRTPSGRWGAGAPAIALACCLIGPACAPPPEGPPAPTPEQANRIGDLARDLVAVDGTEQATREFQSSLQELTPFGPPDDATAALASAMTAALANRALDGRDRQRLAQLLFELMNGGYLDQPALTRTLGGLDDILARSGSERGERERVGLAARRVAREIRDPAINTW